MTRPTLIHTHFHRRKTGLTRSVENVLPFFTDKFDTFIYGYGIDGTKITTKQVLKRIFSKGQVIVHCHRNIEMMRMLFFRFLGGEFKLIVTRHAETPPSGLTNFLLKKADIIIALTKNMSANLKSPNVIVEHGVNIEVFSPKSSVKLSQIKQKNIITCAGRVREAKGQRVLLEAVAPLLKAHQDWALGIAGKIDNPTFLEALKSIIKTNNVEKQVYFLGEVSEIVKVYQASHTVIVPSFTEGFSLVCAEAMSCGCNVIATKNVGVHSDIITHQKNGYLFEAGNEHQLQEVTKQVIDKKLIHLGGEARKEIVQNWSAKKEAEDLASIYLNT